MTRPSGTAVLAIGLDAAEPTLIRRAIDAGELPALRDLARDGLWRRVDSPARIGSGAVWPTFFTGSDPTEHGVYSYWGWDPARMRLTVYDPGRFVPFWRDLARNGATIGVLDVPFAPFVGVSGGFEVSEWGAHDIVNGRMAVAPAAVRGLVAASGGPHPFSAGHEYLAGLDDGAALSRLGAGCVDGARMRGDLATRLIAETHPALALVVFSELHRAGHHLWWTVEPEHPAYRGRLSARARAVTPTLIDVYREVDRQIGRLIETAGPEATVVVFSLHGMRPTRGLSPVLESFLFDRGLAHLEPWGGRSWTERGLSTLAAVKNSVPSRLKKLYHTTVPRAVRHRVAPPTTLPPYDWSRTQAFALPTDQHGWIRLNVAGREAEGIVAAERYDELCDEIEGALRALQAEDGAPVVRDVLRPPHPAGGALGRALPDLVVHWNGVDSPVRFARAAVAAPRPSALTGQHALDGFCLMRSRHAAATAAIGEPVAARDLHRSILAALAASAGDVPRPSR